MKTILRTLSILFVLSALSACAQANLSRVVLTNFVFNNGTYMASTNITVPSGQNYACSAIYSTNITKGYACVQYGNGPWLYVAPSVPTVPSVAVGFVAYGPCTLRLYAEAGNNANPTVLVHMNKTAVTVSP